MLLRQRQRGHTTSADPLNIVRELDAFPKIPDEYKVGTCVGGIRKCLLMFACLRRTSHPGSTNLVIYSTIWPAHCPLVSLTSRLLIALLVYRELQWWWDAELAYRFQPDHSMADRLPMHIDLTVATPCRSIGADIMDRTSQTIHAFGQLHEEDTWWEMDAAQRSHFEFVQAMNAYLREEWHSLTVSACLSLVRQ